MASAIYALAALAVVVVLLIFVLILRRDVALHVEWGRKVKKIWFERLPRGTGS